jgi:sugar/nucleoside kinase (ribokinase family)
VEGATALRGKEVLDELLDSLKKSLELHVVVMPDFFLDRIVTLAKDAEEFARNLHAIIAQKGGSIDGIRQSDIRGGNAVNTASALSALGVKVTPIVCTSKHGLQLLRIYLRGRKLDFSHIKVFDNPSVTTALEFGRDTGRVNVMLRDVGALEGFGPRNLKESDYRLIENADYMCVFNWAGTRQFGTELAETVFNRAKTHGKGKTYYDTADPQPNCREIPNMMKKVLLAKCVDILSVNENEAVTYASCLSSLFRKAFPSKARLEEVAKHASRLLASRLHSRIDLHATRFSATFTKRSEKTVAAVDVEGLRATGAGDAWNAGNIMGDALGVSDECRLTLANLVAGYYISDPRGMHPTRKQLASFINKLQQRQREG